MYKAMSRVRWYFNCRDWAPSEQEWVKAMACIQEEESERINKFVFRDDAKLSLVSIHYYDIPLTLHNALYLVSCRQVVF